MTKLFTLFTVFFLIGCSDSNDTPQIAGESDSRASSQSLPEIAPAETPEELLKNITAVLEAGSIEQLKELIHWEGTFSNPDEMLIVMMEADQTGDLKVENASVRQADDEDQIYGASLKADHMLKFEIVEPDGGRSYQNHPVVTVNDECLLYFVSGE